MKDLRVNGKMVHKTVPEKIQALKWGIKMGDLHIESKGAQG